MKRELAGIVQRLQSAIKRMQDMQPVFPDAAIACENVIEMDLSPALEAATYLMEVSS